MKTTELMLGDFVYYKSQICRIISLDCIGGLVGVENESVCDLVGENELSPVILTAEIFEANGFRKYLNEWQNTTKWFDLYTLDNGTFGANGFGGRLIKIKYIHELQRALRCCGLFDLTDNFKIK